MRKLTERKIVIASHNQGKVRELRALMDPLGYEVATAADLDLDEPEETGATFEANAELKALAAAKVANMPALADDSGLSVDALNGDPGIYSARWAGPDKDFRLAMKKVTDRLSGLPPKKRSARFVSVICLAWPDGHTEFFRGEVEGVLTESPVGDGGFGYDPIFVPEGHARTFGEMGAEEKQALSHRTRAFAKFADQCLVEAGP
ncbi:RdgB/HAM1 family non-canonical purine NTP pyrophosphatase [Hoeflea sp. WL0058]|uniref:dITP/XTP pyrophosphatase n=1 Tax=Flavimaribacter sediminis TaxID=2865987 RepID=A0AAE3D1T0_9HYPH|nr:RdgB/HAM1 family non-canonical purine NTP pyrophosphatase [Flavimaribacter sediminis]MBW8638211.1 RdgB/HAM1 family non-canonical purine NTP pyrophosphatase [Flavimaribacter sediminis]